MGEKMGIISNGALVTFCSPAGATRVAAEVIEKTLRSLSVEVAGFPLCVDNERETALRVFQETQERFRLLFVGSPVYGFHPLPPVMDFIRRLPPLKGVHAVPFVTWGGVCSGSALFEMGTELHKKGACLAGAFRIPAEHSMSWNFSRPFCAGRPNDRDLSWVSKGVGRIYERILSGGTNVLSPPEISFYSGKRLAEMFEGGFETSKARFPKLKFNEALCTGCGQCAEACPVECVSLSPAPIMGDACIMCYNCVKTCPEGALSADFSKSEDIIRKRIKLLKEPQITVVLPKED